MLHMTFFMFGLPKASSSLALKTKHDSKSGITNSLKTWWFWCLIKRQAFHAKHYDSLYWCLFLWSRPSIDGATFPWKGHLTWDSVSTSSRAYQVQDKVVPSLWGKSDYCLGLYIYTGRAPCIQYAEAIGIGEEKNVTIKNMVGLLTRYGLLWFHLYLLASIFGDLVWFKIS